MNGLSRSRLVTGVLACLLVPVAAVAQTTHLVSDETQLRAAILSAANGDTIRLQSNITLSADLPAIVASLTLDGGGFALSGNSQHRGLLIASGGGFTPPPISVALQDLTIIATVATGGAGSDGIAGGGGGAGLGGAIYVGPTATLTVSNVTIAGTAAEGGAGGLATGIAGTSLGGGFGLGGGGGTVGLNGGNGTLGGGGAGGTVGGSGGYGGGGGGSITPNVGGIGGSFGGNGGTLGGGGGAALGGAVFVEGSMVVAGALNIGGSAVSPGSGGGDGGAGQAHGNGIFLSGSGILQFATPAGSVSHIQDSITDENGAGLPFGGFWGIDKAGSGTLILSGDNRYSLGTFVTGGVLQIDRSANLGTGDVFLDDGTTLSIMGGDLFTQALYLPGAATVRVAAGRTVTWSGLLFDQGDFTIPGTLRISGGGTFESTNLQNVYSLGTVVIGGSTLRVAADGALGAPGTSISLGDSNSTGTLSIFAGSNFASSRPIVLGQAGGVLDAQAGASLVLDGIISGSGGLTKTGTGTLRLNGLNTYAGATSVEAGLLRAGAANIFSAGAGMNVSGGAMLDLNGFGQSVAGLTGAGAVDLGAAVFTIGANGASSAFAGSIIGGGSLVKAGNGVLTLTGANSYGGGTLVSGGVLLGHSTSLQGSIVNNATIVFDQGFDGTYAGVMSGFGALVKNGAGTLTLTGANTYNGGTAVLAGTLVGTTTSLRGTILNSGTVVFDQGTSGTYLGSLSGAGNLVKSGSGLVVLGSANSYAGGTSVLGGVLQAGASGAFGTGGLFIGGGAGIELAGFSQSVSGLSGDGSLALGSATIEIGGGGENSSFGGVISGTGGLVKAGTGTLVLGGANTYGGGTLVNGGALVGTTTSLHGTIVNNARVVFDQDSFGTFAGAITGAGQVQKSGNGTVMLTGALQHTGGTVITGGALIGSADTLRGVIVNGSSVTFGGGANGTFAGILAGNGLYNKAGAGTLTINGIHEHGGLFDISQGVLSVDGLFGSRFTVGPNGTLRALGTLLGSVTVDGALAVPASATSFTVAPAFTNASTGDALTSPPLLTIGGNLAMNPGSTLFLPVGSGPNPTIFVGGQTTLNGTTVNVTPLEPLTRRATSFLALASQNGLSMQNTTGVSEDPLLLPYLKQDGNLLFVTMLNLAIPLSASVNNPNASSVGEAIDKIKQGATGDRLDVIRELTSLDDDELEDALRQVSGEAHATMLLYGVRDSEMASDIVRRQIASRRREIRMGAKLGRTWWGQLGGERTRLANADGDRVGTIDIGSGMGGMDYRPSEKWLFGFGGGFSGGSMGLSDLTSAADMQSPRGFGYAGWNPKGFGLRGGGSFARQRSETRRRIVFVATLPDELGGDPLGDGINRQAEAEEVTLINDQWSEWDREHEFDTYTFEWLVGIRRATFTRRTFTENGADALSLLLPEQTVSLRQTNVVMNLWRREGTWRPFFEFLYRREITDGKTTTELEFPGEPDSRFFVDGLPAPKNITHARGGTTWFSSWGTWTFEYQYRKATGQTTHSSDLRWRF